MRETSADQVIESSEKDGMESGQHQKIVSFVWGIADDVLRDFTETYAAGGQASDRAEAFR